jgi:large subunit ribosomal protein L24e
MKKNPRKTRWTKAFRKVAGKEMVLDSTFEFEKRRHRPEKYDREKMAVALRAMKKVAEIKDKRERAFIKKRMKVKKVHEKVADMKELKQNIDIIKPAAVRLRQKVTGKSAERMADD